MSLDDELAAIEVAVAATDLVWRKRAREMIVRAVVQAQIDNDELRQEPGRHLQSYRDALRQAAEAIADRLLASVDKPGAGGGANPLP
ncbi:MAG TPA: hypothetical protein VNM87_12070 [Candidatus Udaeobacter sp.]|nr:hypothetical protein [Candidatus Udaeobacter sp.]